MTRRWTEKDWLFVYDTFREMHRTLDTIDRQMDETAPLAIISAYDAVRSTLYAAESIAANYHGYPRELGGGQ